MRQLTGTALLVRAHLRAGWRGLVTSVLLAAGLVVATAWSIGELYPTRANRLAYATAASSSPAMDAFNGRAYDLTTLGGIVSYEVGFLGLIGMPVIALHLAIRFSRHEEDSGRTELVTSGRIGRLAPLAAAATTVLLGLTCFMALCGVGLAAAGLPLGGSWWYAASLGLLAGGFGALGLLLAEISRESRIAYTAGLTLVLVTFMVRALVDGLDWNAAWVSPLGWLAEARPWGDRQWWPLAAYAVLAAVALALAGAMATHRDLYGGLLEARPGPTHAPRRLGTSTGLVWRFTKTPFVGWLIGTALWSVGFGALAGEMTDLMAANPSLREVLGLAKPEYVVTSLALLLCAIGASAAAVHGLSRLAGEEVTGRLGLVLSTRAARGRVWGTWVLIVIVESLVVLLVSTLGLGFSSAWSTGDPSEVGSVLGAGLVVSVPVVLVAAVCAVLQAVGPRAAVLGWLLVGYATVVGVLAETLRLPEWLRDLSPLHAAGNVPIEDPRVGALVVMALLGGALLAVGGAVFGRRDLIAG